MVKCMVHSCRNYNDTKQEDPNRARKKFFRFPKDKARVKVWLAALRESEREIPDYFRICEDHFLTHHITHRGISPDAIPITPSLDDRELCSDDGRDECGMSAIEEDSNDYEEFEDDDDDDDDNTLADSGSNSINSNGQRYLPMLLPKGNCNNNFVTPRVPIKDRSEVALGPLTKRFMKLLLAAPNGILDLNEAARTLGTRKRRVYDITSVLGGIQLVKKTFKNNIQWVGSVPLGCFGGQRLPQTSAELLKLKSAEESLDMLIKDVAEQLFILTELQENAKSAYVTHDDICQIGVFKDQTIISVRAPEETKLEVPTPTESSIQIHLKGCRGPIHVLTCETEGPSDSTDSTNRASELSKPDCFLTLEKSRIHTKTLIRDAV